MEINNWKIFYHKIFKVIYKELIYSVQKLKKKNPNSYKSHYKTKLLASIQYVIKKDVPNNPTDPKYRLGHTLGEKHSHWRRVKNNMPPRYRMFFRFRTNYHRDANSDAIKCIIFVWFNDISNLRKKDSKTDVYNVFYALIKRGKIPDNWTELLEQSSDNFLL